MRLWSNHSCHKSSGDFTPFSSAEVSWLALMLALCHPALSGHFLLILSCCHLLFIFLTINASQGRNCMKMEEPLHGGKQSAGEIRNRKNDKFLSCFTGSHKYLQTYIANVL